MKWLLFLRNHMQAIKKVIEGEDHRISIFHRIFFFCKLFPCIFDMKYRGQLFLNIFFLFFYGEKQERRILKCLVITLRTGAVIFFNEKVVFQKKMLLAFSP